MKKAAGNRLLACSLALALGFVISAGAPISMTKKENAAETIHSLNKFKRIMLLDRGRLKPIDTYAENLLLQFSGKKSLNHKPAVDWFARTLFAPGTALSDKVFLINNAEIADAMGIAPERGRRYGADRLMPGLRKLSTLYETAMRVSERERSAFDLEIIRLTENVSQYTALLQALRFTVTIDQLAIYGSLDSGSSDTLRATSALLWANIASSFAVGDQDAFDKASEKLAAFIATTWPGALSAKDPGIELVYNRFDLFGAAKIFYGIGLLFLALYMPLRLRGLYGTAAAILLAGGIVHTLGLVLRLIIMERPPVTNMYETFIFVGWMAVVLGGVTELFQKHGWGLAIAALSGFSLLHIAGKFGLEGDTMGMLAAVLNNNFWLTSHVITIACGYSGCIATGLLSHIVLIRGVFFRRIFPTSDSLDLCVYGILAFGLTFTVIGTVLGGLWADQAWGRFWGWDPKENGALVIILWCAFLFHMRRTNWLGRQGFAAGCVIGLSLVLCAWLGVNLLGIGMHAYGFTSTGARVLFSVLGFEAAFLISIGIAAILNTARKKRNDPALAPPSS